MSYVTDIEADIARIAAAAGISRGQARDIVAAGARESGEMLGDVASRIAEMSGTLEFLRDAKTKFEREKEGGK